MGKKKKLEETAEKIEAGMEQMSKLPDVLLDKVLKQGILSVFILAAGIFSGTRMGAWDFVFWSIALGGFFLYKAGRMLAIARKGQYETVEGKVVKTGGKYGIGRMYKLQVRQKDGKETTLLMDRGNKLKEGQAYRFYFSSTKQALSGIDGLDAVLSTDTFYGYEELESWDA